MVSVGLDTLKPKQNHHLLQTTLWNLFSGQNLIVSWFKFQGHLLSGVQLTTRYYWFRWCLGAKQHISRLSQIWPILLKLICTTRPQWDNFRSVARLCDPVSLSYIVWSAKTCSKLFISDILSALILVMTYHLNSIYLDISRRNDDQARHIFVYGTGT